MIYYKDINNNIYTGDKADYKDVELTGQELDTYLLSKARTSKYNEINSAFDNAMETGHFISTIINVDIDCRRDSTHNDLQNVQGLIDLNVPSINYKGVSEEKIVTLEQLNQMKIEMIEYAFSIYQHKWDKEAEIKVATTFEQIEAIIW